MPMAAFVVLFVGSHLASMHGGPRALHDVLGGQPIFDQRPSFSATDVYARVAAFGDVGRAAYSRLTYTGDLLFPLVLLTFLVQLQRFLSARAGGRYRALLLVPAAWFLADLTENAMIYTLLRDFPTRHEGLAGALGAVTTFKFALLAASVLTAAWTSTRLDVPRA